eukprot:gene5481-3955_t
MKSSNPFAFIRPLGIALRSCVHPTWESASGSFLRATSHISKGSTLALIPETSIVSVSRVADKDNFGFAASPDFLDGKYPLVVLAHFVSLQYILGNSWFACQLPHYAEDRSVARLYGTLKSELVTAPEAIFSQAYAYVSRRCVEHEGVDSLIPIVDMISSKSAGNVEFHSQVVGDHHHAICKKFWGSGYHKRKLFLCFGKYVSITSLSLYCPVHEYETPKRDYRSLVADGSRCRIGKAGGQGCVQKTTSSDNGAKNEAAAPCFLAACADRTEAGAHHFFGAAPFRPSPCAAMASGIRNAPPEGALGLFDKFSRLFTDHEKGLTAADLLLSIKAMSRVMLLDDAFYETMSETKKLAQLSLAAQRDLVHAFGAVDLPHPKLAERVCANVASRLDELPDANSACSVLLSLRRMGYNVGEDQNLVAAADYIKERGQSQTKAPLHHVLQVPGTSTSHRKKPRSRKPNTKYPYSFERRGTRHLTFGSWFFPAEDGGARPSRWKGREQAGKKHPVTPGARLGKGILGEAVPGKETRRTPALLLTRHDASQEGPGAEKSPPGSSTPARRPGPTIPAPLQDTQKKKCAVKTLAYCNWPPLCPKRRGAKLIGSIIVRQMPQFVQYFFESWSFLAQEQPEKEIVKVEIQQNSQPEKRCRQAAHFCSNTES